VKPALPLGDTQHLLDRRDADLHLGPPVLPHRAHPLLSGEVARLPGPGLEGGRELLHYYSSDAVALRSGRYKYLLGGFWDTSVNLFDIAADPGETTNLAGERAELARQMKERLVHLASLVSSLEPLPR